MADERYRGYVNGVSVTQYTPSVFDAAVNQTLVSAVFARVQICLIDRASAVLGKEARRSGSKCRHRSRLRAIPHRHVLSRFRVCVSARPFSRSFPHGCHFLVQQCFLGRHRGQGIAQLLRCSHRGGDCRWAKIVARGCVPQLRIV